MSDTESKSISWAGTRASALSKTSGGPVVKKKSLSDDEVSALLHATSFPFSSSIGVFRLVRVERCIVVLEMYWYLYRKASSFLFLLLSATVVSVFLSCSPYSP